MELGPLDPAFLENPWPHYRRLRDGHPAWWDPARSAYLVSRYADVVAVAGNWADYSSEPAKGPTGHIAQMDPPDHDRHRAKVLRRFTPRAVAVLETEVRAVIAGLLSPIGSSGEIELVEDFAARFPSAVISRIVGVPAPLEEEFRERSLAVAEAAARPGYPSAMSALEEVAGRVVRTRPARPGGILETLLDDGAEDTLSRDELVALVTNVVLAGTDTVTNLITSAVVLLDERRDVLALLDENPARCPGALEEVLRLESPAQLLWRWTTRPVVLAGTTLPEGAEVQVLWGSANRDEREFPDPDRFDIDRPRGRHVAFGRGLHHCLGAALARLEGRLAFEALVPLLREREVDRSGLVRLPSLVFRGFSRVPLVTRSAVSRAPGQG